jgi:uncharacterized protein (DUF305 family)
MTQVIRASAIAAAVLFSLGANASEYTADSSGEEHVPVVVRDVFVGKDAAQRAMQTDLEFARNMARHHQGAVDMATAYLNDPRGANPIVRRLSRGIIHNQAFEIALLDVVRQHVEAGPQPLAQVGGREFVALNRGVDGLEHEWFFVKAPAPSVADFWLTPGLKVSDFDVQFARSMIQHHSAAIDMAMRYNTNPDGGSSVLGPLNIGILIDQRYEIGFLRRLIARYPGDPATVADDPKMMEIMHRSMGGMPMSGMDDSREHDGQAHR